MIALDSTPKKTAAVPLARLRAGALEAVNDEQRREWLARLGWDLTDVSEFVAAAIRSRSLRGSAVLVDGEVAGFGFFTLEPGRATIGDLFVRSSYRTPDTCATLVEAVVQQVRHTKPRARIESQSILLDAPAFDEPFVRLGFARHARDYLAIELPARAEDARTGHQKILVRPWTTHDYASVAEVVYQAYRGTVDASINTQYRSREGCADLLDALTDSLWCGRFRPDIARVAVDRETGKTVGVAVVSAISERAAHFGQISVAPGRQNEGIGRAMLTSALAAAEAAGFASATLAVTRENHAASRLYRSVGFRPRLEFAAYVRNAAPVDAKRPR
jgi:ribosomal protein S18 acetylase RimI-like enzyme